MTTTSDPVAFGEPSHNGVELCAHADINDEGQTVTVTKPEVGTTATDGLDGDKNVVADTDATVTDTVDCKNLTPGKTYKVTGTLYKKVTDEAGNVSEEKLAVNGQDVTAEAEFVAEQADGTVEVTFHFDGSHLPAGTPLVRTSRASSHNGIELGAHADINDEGQTVTVIVPDVTTMAADGLDRGQAGRGGLRELRHRHRLVQLRAHRQGLHHGRHPHGQGHRPARRHGQRRRCHHRR